MTLSKALTVNERFDYTYWERLWTSLLTTLCCCQGCKRREFYKRRVERLARYEEVSSRLTREMSLHALLRTIRLTEFIAQVLDIKAYQWVLVNKQRKYQVTSLGKKAGKDKKKPRVGP